MASSREIFLQLFLNLCRNPYILLKLYTAPMYKEAYLFTIRLGLFAFLMTFSEKEPRSIYASVLFPWEPTTIASTSSFSATPEKSVG
jgi:hypothetical protein